MTPPASTAPRRARPAQAPDGFVAGLPARQGAFALLSGVLWRGQALEQATRHASFTSLTGADHALAFAIARATLRCLTDLDALIDGVMATPVARDARVRLVLQMALAQRLVLDLPIHAVIATSLALLRGGPRRLAHGVLSRLEKQGVTLPNPPRLPAPFAEKWAHCYGAEVRDAIARAAADMPALDLALKDAGRTAEWATTLEGVSLAPGHVRLTGARGRDVAHLPGFESGDWWAQDLAAQLPVRLLGDVSGRQVLDLCAAPGGKTLQLAAAGAQVTALDLSESRLKRLAENLARTGLSARIVPADAGLWEADTAYDAIMLDAPCSATGTLRRHPDVLPLKAQSDWGALVALQRRLLTRAVTWLKPGGALIYAVCSLEPEEGEEQAAWACANLPVTLEAIGVDELGPLHAAVTPQGWARVTPATLEGGCDGFFIARFRALGGRDVCVA